MGFLLRFAGKACRIVALPSGAPPHGQSPMGPHLSLGALFAFGSMAPNPSWV